MKTGYKMYLLIIGFATTSNKSSCVAAWSKILENLFPGMKH